MKFALVLLFALVITTLAAHHGHKAHKVIQLSSVPSLKGPVTYNTIPVSIWSDGTVYYSTVPTAAPENPQDLATVSTRQVLTGKIDVDNLADFLLFAVDNEYTTLENKYEAKDQEPNPTSTCLTIFDKNGVTESCELNDKVAPQLFQDLVCKIRALVASAQNTKTFVPEDAYIRAYSISKKGVSAASIWGGKQLLVDSEKGVWFHKKHAAAAFEAAVKGTVFDYQGQYVQLTAQVHGISLVDPSSKADKVHDQSVANTKLYLVMVIMMALVIAFVIASVVFFVVRMCSKVVKAYESDAHLVGDEEEGHAARSDDEISDEEYVQEDERPLLSVQAEEVEPVDVQQQQQQFVAPVEPTQYFYVIPQNSVVFPNEQYALPNNFGPFPQALTYTPEQQ